VTREWVIDEYRGFEGLRLQSCVPGEPGPTDVRLRVEAFALNWGDADLMNNAYSFSFSEFPARIGIEAAGIVDAVGSEVMGIEIGDRYCTLPYFYDLRGASADTMLIDQAYVTKAPEGLTAVEAAAVWMQFMTAYFPIVELAKAGPGTNLLIPAGTSTAGAAALQIARMMGATAISTSRSEENRQYIIDQGAEHVFIDDGGDIESFLFEVTNGVGIHTSFDPIGDDFMERYGMAMVKGGNLLMYGGLTGTYAGLPFLPMVQRNLWFHVYSLFNYVGDASACARGKAFVYDALSSGDLRPSVDRVFPMESYIEAWRYMKGHRDGHGKVVIETGA